MDNERFWQWLSLQRDFERHSANCWAALRAIDHTDKVVNRHLMQIVQRELAHEDFVLTLLNAPALGFCEE